MFPRSSRQPKKPSDLAIVFVHAGAGYHSKENEIHHLQACESACKAAMALLRPGGSAVDAVEIAIRVLEDKEITNAGFGSNLGIDGVVECDAIVVDHFGRSGAVGAVAQIRNPISLARMLLDHTTQALSLRRVPPNLLVGAGATNFASEHGMQPVHYDTLISPYARHRWQKWRADLQKIERHRRREEAKAYGGLRLPESDIELPTSLVQSEEHERQRKEHSIRAIQAAEMLYNDAQPLSPPPSDDCEGQSSPSPQMPLRAATAPFPSSIGSAASSGCDPDSHLDTYTDPRGPPQRPVDIANHPFANSSSKLGSSAIHDMMPANGTQDGGIYFDYDVHMRNGTEFTDTLDEDHPVVVPPHEMSHDGSPGSSSNTSSATSKPNAQETSTPSHAPALPFELAPRNAQPVSNKLLGISRKLGQPPPLRDEDHITDTVGVIAIDMYGKIACGASSGGISMKHRGRVGPAALVGVGATVIPIDEDDEDKTAVATVTSGTGEHMSTTLASSVCSDRVYRNEVRAKGGEYKSAMMEDLALKGFIERDFMGHPSVKNSDSSGAIGVLSVKKTVDGVQLLYAHNTDSFALASMHSDEKTPVCTMSRNAGNGAVAQGGRPLKLKRGKK